MPEKTIKRRLEDTRDAAFASDEDQRIFSTIAQLVEALKRSIPEGSETAERKKEARALGVNCCAERSTKRIDGAPSGGS